MWAWMSLNFRQIRSLTTELAALERLKNRIIMLRPFLFPWQLIAPIGAFIFDGIFIRTGNKDNNKVLDEFEL